MKPTTLKEIATWCQGTVEQRFEHVTVSSLIHDSREAEHGALFFALTGQNDGHDYIPAAMEKGASAVVCSRRVEGDFPYVLVEDTRKALRDIATAYKATLTAKTVAITGSVGKTTTRTMVSALMEKQYCTCSTVKNYNNDIGLPVTLGTVSPDCEMLVLEMGMNHFGEMRVLTEIGRPDTVLITNIGSMHIEALGSREGILKAKLEILEGLNPGGDAIFNGDEPLLWDLRSRINCDIIYFGIENPKCDVRGTDIVLSQGGSTFRVEGLGHDFMVSIPVSGIHNVHNALGAITTALRYGVPVEKIQKAMETYENTSQRQHTYEKNGFIIIDDTYNAGPESMEAALRVLGDTRGKGEKFRRIAVLGEMLELGNHASSEHYRIGRVAAYKADMILTYGELSKKIVNGAITGGVKQRNAMNFSTHQELINVVKNRAKPGDVLLFKGSHGSRMDLVLAGFLKED